MNQNDRFNCRVPITAGNPRNLGGFSQIGFEYVVTATSTSSGPGGRSNAYSFEVLGSAEGLPIGTIRTAQIPLISGSKETLLEYVARVEAAPQGQQDKFGVTKVWTDPQAFPVANTSFGNWAPTETVDNYVSVSDDNLFFTGPRVGIKYQVDGLRQELQVVGLNSDRVFHRERRHHRPVVLQRAINV